MSLFHSFYVLFFFLLFSTQTWADLNSVQDIKKSFSRHLVSRNQYLDRLAALRFEIMMSEDKITPREDAEISEIDDEMRKNLMTSTYDDRLLSRLRVGKWESPRHDYLYRSDGSWTMLPIIPDVTHGRWKIEGNAYYDWVPIHAPKKLPYKIVLLDENYFISFSDHQLFYEKRLK